MGSKTTRRVRDYREIVGRLQKISRRQKLSLDRIGEASGHELFLMESGGTNGRARSYFLSAGTHGDEPAAVEGLLRWLERGSWRDNGHNLFVLPCINPWGYEHDTRENEQGIDINRQFRLGDCVEAQIVLRALRGRRFDLGVELHEDIDSPGFYMYELKSARPYLGETLVRAVAKAGPINRARVIEGAQSRGGVIRPANFTSKLLRRKRWPLAFYLYSYHTSHKLTLETPGPREFEVRVTMHLAALDAAIGG